MQNTIPKHLSVTKENNRLDHSRRFPMAASLFPHSVFSRSNTIARTNSCTTQDTSPLLQRMSDFARNVRTVFSWDPRDHIAGDSDKYQQDGKTFLFPSQFSQGDKSRLCKLWLLSEVFCPSKICSANHASQNSFLVLTAKSNIPGLCLH